MSRVQLCVGWFTLFCLLCSQTSLSTEQVSASAGRENLFSVWIRLSMIGYSQSEIESTLSYLPDNQLKQVKHLVRLNVIKTLKGMNLSGEIERSNHPQSLASIRRKILTEIRFAGLENDHYLRYMIQNYFGISVDTI